MSAAADILSGVVLKRYARARCLRLRVDPVTGTAVLTLPKRTSRAEALRFIIANQDWISTQKARLRPASPFEPGQVFTLFGDEVVLVHESAHRGAPRIEDGRLVAGGRSEFFQRRIRDFVHAESLKRFAPVVQDLAAALGVRAARVTMRDVVSRWGSCSATGAINLNWRLAFAPPAVARYVLAHEVAHLREMNHSRAFWSLVTQLVGDYRAERLWLTRHGAALMRIGVSEKG